MYGISANTIGMFMFVLAVVFLCLSASSSLRSNGAAAHNPKSRGPARDDRSAHADANRRCHKCGTGLHADEDGCPVCGTHVRRTVWHR